MVYAYQMTGLDVSSFAPLLESLIDSGDILPGAAAIAYPNEDPSAKNIYVVSVLSILKDSEDCKTLDGEAFAEVCRLVSTGTFAVWGNPGLFQDHHGLPSATE